MDLSSALTERLLSVMDRKHHWAYPALTRPGLSRPQLLSHFQHEYAVYVCDFPVLLARALGQVPPLADVRASLAENLYEEQTGGLSRSAPHPELFLRMMEGLGFSRARFDEGEIVLLPEAARYREFLRAASAEGPWQAAVALLTIFVEGSVHEREELAGTFRRPPARDAARRHPLVVHYGCPEAAMDLVRAHAAVEGGHRSEAWKVVLGHAAVDAGTVGAVATTVERALSLWLAYRDGVARTMGLARDHAA